MNYVATGNINPCRFVAATSDFSVTQATNGDLPCGISTDAQKAAPVSGASTLAAVDDDHINVHGVGEECLLELGGTVSAGDLLMSDSVGRGVTAETTGVSPVGARAVCGGASGEKVRVVVQFQSG